MMHARIPCTAQVLTRNSATGLQACLASLGEIDEVLLLDGYSTDQTQQIASHFENVRVVPQDRASLDAENRIMNFAAIRNQGLRAASHEWILIVDADEYVGSALLAEIREITQCGQPGVFQVFRRFYIDGMRIDHSSWYPALQIRLFHRSLTSGYVKEVHERLCLQQGICCQTLQTELPTPLPPVTSLLPKYRRYTDMEAARLKNISVGRWFRWILLRNIRTIAGLSFRIASIRIFSRKGVRMPLSYEWAYIRTSMGTIVRTFPRKRCE